MTTRERLLDATERIIRTRGLLAVTTKDIAQEAGFAEATLYRHFEDKAALLLAVFAERMPAHYLSLIRDFPARAGTGTVAGHLEQLATAALAFFAQTAPLSVAIAADPALAARHYTLMRELRVGPDVALEALATYLRAEQRLGRARPDANPAVAATMLLGVCFNYAYGRHVTGMHPTSLPEEEFAPEIVRTLLTGLSPPN